mmetsp:Transcript_19067/g.35941  ORF Transcript_19067/g.35941 Transcript_19067/m.35941 type:complete len:383 (+) Transcript_19067:143-1291(+)
MMSISIPHQLPNASEAKGYIWSCHCLFSEAGLDKELSDSVRVTVRGRTTVFEISLSSRLGASWDTNGASTVGDAKGEALDGSSLVLAGKTLLVVLTVGGNVLLMVLLELGHHGFDDLHAALGTGALGGEVGVASSAVPVALLDRLRGERAADVVVLAAAEHEVTREPEVVTHLDTLARSNLELPLGRHDLGVDSGNLDAGVKASPVVGLDELTADGVASTNTAVIRTLGTSVAALRESKRPLDVSVEHGVLLLEAKPWLFGLVLVHGSDAGGTLVGFESVALVIVGVAENDDVLSATERVAVDLARLDDHLGVMSGGLLGGRTVVVPFRKLLDVLISGLNLEVEGAALGADVPKRSAEPDVFGLDLSSLVKAFVVHFVLGGL